MKILKDNGKNIRDNLSMRLALERLSNGTFVYIIVTYCFYRDNDIVRIFVRRAAVLPLVSPELFEDVWFSALEDRRDCHQHDSFCRLCYRVLGRRKQPSAMEPLRQRGSTYQQPPREMARQVKEAPQPRTPQHLLLNRSSPENTR